MPLGTDQTVSYYFAFRGVELALSVRVVRASILFSAVLTNPQEKNGSGPIRFGS